MQCVGDLRTNRWSEHSRTRGQIKDVLVTIHVDDFLIAGDKKFLDDTEDALKERFTFGKIEAGKFKFTGLNIKESPEGIFIDQNDYVQSLHPIKIDKLAGKEEKLSKEKFAEFRGLTGQLSWACSIF